MSAQVELRFSIARKFGLDPRSLLESDKPTFVWNDEAKFKHLKGETESERSAISGYGISIGRFLIAGSWEGRSIEGADARDLRGSILANKRFIEFQDLLGLCWGVGIPVIYLRVFPLSAKRMCAMSINFENRFAIMLAKDSEYPAPISFYLAHELGHIALGHVQHGGAFVDLSDSLSSREIKDSEEREADRYAMELLTGSSELTINTSSVRISAKDLAENVLNTGPQVGIEPGMLALCFGYSSKQWASVNAAMKLIYDRPLPVWREVNGIAQSQLDWDKLPDDFGVFVRGVMGLAGGNDGGH